MLMLKTIDHLIYLAPDLEVGINEIEKITGVRPMITGRHLQWGTWNAMLSLGDDCFFEIIAIDPSQSRREKYILGLENLTESKMYRWVAKSDRIDQQIERARNAGFSIGEKQDGERVKPDGSKLKWTLTDPMADEGNGLIPFLIDWKDSPHPGASTPTGCELINIRATHPKADQIRQMLRVLDLELDVQRGENISLTVELQTPNGIVKI